MKYLTKLTSVLIICLFIFSCSNEPVANNQNISLKFKSSSFSKNSNSTKTSNTLIITSEVIFVDGLPKLTSDELVEISVINSETNQQTYAYILKSEYEKAQNSSSESRLGDCEPSVETGYGFTGRCFVFGTFYNGDNCQTIFVPCGLNCIGFDDVCPAWNEAFA